MVPATGMIALDTNLLIYAHRATMPEHSAARRAIERAVIHPQGWGIPLPCLAEFWSVVTHPAATGTPARRKPQRFLSPTCWKTAAELCGSQAPILEDVFFRLPWS